MSACVFCGFPETYLRHAEHADPDSLSSAQRKALAIYADVTDRHGIKQEFFAVDGEVTEEILREWERILEL